MSAWINLRGTGTVQIAPSTGDSFRIVPEVAFTLAALPGTSGQRITVRIEQGATGYAVTYDGSITGGPTVVTTAAAVTWMELVWDEQTRVWETVPYLSSAAASGAYQPLNASLTSLSGITVSAAGLAILDDANAAAQRTTLGLGTMATQNAVSVTIAGGSITGITDIAVADGGTGASDAAGARTNLGLGSIATKLTIVVPSDSVAADVAALKADFNALLANLRTSQA